ncbi:MAG: phosphatidylglycerophosphatase A [Bacteroidetes bacterium 46-16]|nr:MAG: phosphatidylglycerophosphatase A [Bacteroidetes bacterium 46-16]
MITFHKTVATSLGIGYMGKGGGTVAAIFACICWYAVNRLYPMEPWMQLVIALAVTILGIWSADKVEPLWGKDDKKVVIDEVAGMIISLLLVPVTWQYIIAALVLFRFFDIVKPLYIRKTESLKGGWGVMMDDVLSGVYANIILQMLLLIKLF